MPITEDNFTAEEFQAVIAKKPELLDNVKAGLTPLGHFAFKKDEYDAWTTSEREKIAHAKTSEIYSKLDQDIFAETGIAKTSPEEKTYDYNRRALKQYKEGSNALETKVKDLEKKIADGATDKTLVDKLEAAKLQLAKFETEEKPGYEKKLFAKDVELGVALALQGVKFKPGIPDAVLKPYLQNVQNKMVEAARRDTNGGIYFVNPDNTTRLVGVNTATAADILKIELKDIIDDGRQQQGGGTGAPGAGAATGVKNADGVDIVIPESVKTKVELHDFLIKNGLNENSKAFNEVYTKHGEKLPLR